MTACLHEPEDNALVALKNYFEKNMQWHQEVKSVCLSSKCGVELNISKKPKRELEQCQIQLKSTQNYVAWINIYSSQLVD